MQNNKLFSQYLLTTKLKEWDALTPRQLNIAREVFKRWNSSVDITKERQNQIPFLTEFFGTVLGYQSIAGKADNSLWWEDGSVVDGKKPDGILGLNFCRIL